MDNPDYNSENKGDSVHAAVITTQKIIDSLGRDLNSYFEEFKVSLINVTPAESYGPDAVTLILSGSEKNIKTSLEQLKKLCNKKKLGLETEPIRTLPPIMEGFLNDMEDKKRFEKLFSYCSKEYLDECQKKGIAPHPEVLEGLIK